LLPPNTGTLIYLEPGTALRSSNIRHFFAIAR